MITEPASPPAGIGDLVAAYLADDRPAVPLSLAREWARQARQDGYDAGHTAGYLAAVGETKRVHAELAAGLAASAPQTAVTWTVRCGRHRRGLRGPCGPAGRCERRTRQTYGQPHPDDYPAQGAA
jgi:hypothetical protein